MKRKRHLEQISNSYYNLGLSLAKKRNLSPALNALSISLALNKKNTAARNLFGLIQFEMGEEARALVSWVISINLEPNNNPAGTYLQKIRNEASYLENSQVAVSKYNKALSQIRTKNYDMAKITLSQAVEQRPGFVKALLVLALLNLKDGSFGEAKRLLEEVLKIDRFNSDALSYLDELRPGGTRLIRDEKISIIRSPSSTKRNAAGSFVEARSPISSIYKNYSGLFTAVNIGIGLIIGACAVVFLYMPTMRASLNNTHNKEIVAISQNLNDANATAESLQAENDALNEQVNKLTEVNNTSEENMNHKLIQYVYLSGIIKEYDSKSYTKAAEIFSNLDASQLTDVDNANGISVTALFAEIAPRMREDGPRLLTRAGDNLNRTGDFAGAIAYYDSALRISPDFVEARYKKAMAFKSMGDIDTANELFTEIITNYPDDRYANSSREGRGY